MTDRKDIADSEWGKWVGKVKRSPYICGHSYVPLVLLSKNFPQWSAQNDTTYNKGQEAMFHSMVAIAHFVAMTTLSQWQLCRKFARKWIPHISCKNIFDSYGYTQKQTQVIGSKKEYR